MNDSVLLRKYEKGDEKSIFQLVRLCFGKDAYGRARVEWKWRFEENPFGSYNWIVENHGQIVAHCANIPVNLKVGKKIFKSCIRTGAMTHPKFRRKGLQWKIYSHADDELIKEGIYFTYGFPRDKIFIKHKRKGATVYTCRLPVLVKFFDISEIIRKLTNSSFLAKIISLWANPIIGVFFGSGKNPVVENVKITRIAQFDYRINEFWENVKRYFNVISIRNKEYLNWRYSKTLNPNFNILQAEENNKILGYIVFHSRNEIGAILDLLVFPHRLDVIQSLVSIAVTQLRKEKVKSVVCLMPNNNSYYRVLRANGFMHLRSRLGFGVDVWSSSNVPTNFLQNHNNWYLTFGDSI